MQFKYLVSKLTDPYFNLATEQALMDFASPGIMILFLWQNDNTIVVGRNQDINSECRAELFIKEGGLIARRRSGGGAVFHDIGNLNYSFICHKTDKDDSRYAHIIKDVLKDLGFEAEYNGRNDLTVNGKKVSGNAVYQDGRAVCQHGTLLISADTKRISRYLTPSVSKLLRNGVSSVKARITNLSELSEGIGIDDVIRSFICVTEASKLEIKPDEETVANLARFYGSDAWIYGGEPVPVRTAERKL